MMMRGGGGQQKQDTGARQARVFACQRSTTTTTTFDICRIEWSFSVLSAYNDTCLINSPAHHSMSHIRVWICCRSAHFEEGGRKEPKISQAGSYLAVVSRTITRCLNCRAS